ncbi:hypothetical protein BP6252_11984 [Coleophoma cylindrospora]|uniref:Transcription factor domain-containing protein n=1 Tax=Coleophoma cylindrospora TaxID=1849047 RepID=A0A3D8QFV9_9HELO|nr:hypothetical protein BP6252_11984 [Coleophoma cylindrospora]
MNAVNASNGALNELIENSCGGLSAWSTACIDAYLEYFHPHWPVIHSPTFDLDSDNLMLSASVIMIGCWLEYPKADELVIAVHEKLVDNFLRELCNPGASLKQDSFGQIEDYESMLLNVIFAYSSHREDLVARATILLSLIITALRQNGLLSSEMEAGREKAYKPDVFLPFVLSTREKRTSGQCQHLQIEELDVSLPSTFSLWNTHGLDEFYKRHPQEPTTRVGIRLFNFLRHPELLDPLAWLVEDVHIGICGMHWAVWRYNRTRQNGEVIEPNSKDQLEKQLDFWKVQLDRVAGLCDNVLLKFYLGSERKESPSTLTRVHSLIHDTTLLYNITGLYLYSDVHVLPRSALNPVESAAEIRASTYSQEKNAQIRQWALSIDGRKAVSFCIAVLEAQEKSLTRDKPGGRYVEPIAYAALLKCGAVLSAWFKATKEFNSCRRAPNHTKLLSLEDWINSGGSLAVGDDLLCTCRADAWTRRFTVSLPTI